MKHLSKEIYIATGFFVLLGVAALVYLAIKVGTQTMQSGESYQVIAYFSDASGLTPRTKVTVSGIEVGRIESIELDAKNYQARVVLSLQKGVQLSSDTSAIVASNSLLGGKHVVLQPGFQEDYLQPGDIIDNTQSAISIEGLIQQVVSSFGK